MTTMAAAVNTEVMRQILIDSFQLQTQEGKEELSNLGKVLSLGDLLLVKVLKIKLLWKNCPSQTL